MSKNKVSLVKCASYDTTEVQAAVKRALDLLGGIERFVGPNEKVLLKPNLLTDASPEKGVDTHPEVVRAVIRILKPVTKNIYCGDSPSICGDKKEINRVYEASGIKKVCAEEGVELVYFIQSRRVNGYPLTSWAFSCARMINIPKFKTHTLTVLTACLKNLFGLVVGMHKLKFHFDCPKVSALSKVMVDLYEARRPDLNIVDGVVAMEGDGPGSSGVLRKMGFIAASADGVGLDMLLARLMNVDCLDIPTNREASGRGLGPSGLEGLDIVGERLDDFAAPDFKLPRASVLTKLPPMPEALSRSLMSFLSAKPYVEISKCRLCGTCQKSCPAGALRLGRGRLTFDRSRCILCLCCQEVCPYAAIALKKNLLLRLFQRGDAHG